MAIQTRDQLIEAMAAGRTVQYFKTTGTSVASFFYARFRDAGMPGAAAIATAGSGNTCSRTTVGACPIPPPNATSYITSWEAVGTTIKSIVMCDRLVETSGLSGIVITAQTVNSVALPARATGATDVELWLEIYTLAGTTASASVTASYTNQSGTAGRTATLIGGIPASGTPINRTYPFALQAGDTGVQSVQTVTIGTSTGVAGNIGIVLRRSLLTGFIPLANGGFSYGYAETDLQILPDDACVEFVTLATGTSTGVQLGNFGVAQG